MGLLTTDLLRLASAPITAWYKAIPATPFAWAYSLMAVQWWKDAGF